jgi:glycosyltransferase involved in cell wall biosynthesis
MRALYICYFGLREPLVQTQVLPYLRELARAGTGVGVLTFEPEPERRWKADELDVTRAALKAEGIEWHSLPYHKRPSVPATLYDIFAGAWRVARIAQRGGYDVFHARAHVPLAIALLAQRLVRARLVFDLRGLMAEEYVDAGVWQEESLPFRSVKALERTGLKRADQIVVLTERMREWLVRERKVSPESIAVIPCCVDLSLYSNDATGQSERPELVYAGSVTGLYMLKEMAGFFIELRSLEPQWMLRILTTSSREGASSVLTGIGLHPDDFRIGAVPANEVPRYLRAAKLGISFRKPTFSQIAASPTKIPEYLAAGLPVVSNAGIGDTDQLLESERVGVIVREFTSEAYARSASEALRLISDPAIRDRCRAAARRHFDLETVGGERYRNVYRKLEMHRDSALKTY